MFAYLLICNVVWLQKLKVRRIYFILDKLNFRFFLAAREARAKIIAAEGEQKASRSLKVRFYYN
jgi:hypothetical protein